MQHKDLVIVTPALAAPWGSCEEVLMIALHAQHSAATVPTWRERSPREALIVALTDTNLYRDITNDAPAQASLEAAELRQGSGTYIKVQAALQCPESTT